MKKEGALTPPKPKEFMQEPTPLNIHQRILAVMTDVEYIQKCDKKVNNQYRYVSHDQVSAKLHSHFVKHGIVCEYDTFYFLQEGNRTTIGLETKYINADDPQDFIKTRVYGQGVDQGDKGPGKAFSYASKMSHLKTFCLETGDDPDHDQNSMYESDKKDPSNKIDFIDEIQKKKILELADEERIKKICTHYAADKLDQIKRSDFPVILNALVRKPSRQKVAQ